MEKLIDKYLESKRHAWAPSTKRSESYRLHGISKLLDGNPETLWAGIQSLKPYARLTTWTRVVEFWQWVIDNPPAREELGSFDTKSAQILQGGKNPYEKWRKENARVFKHVYEKRPASISYEECKRRIETIKDPTVKAKALQLLDGALRFTESSTIENGTVRGKGNKVRRVFVSTSAIEVGYEYFYRALKAVGLTPHLLRKVALSRYVTKGANAFELCEIAGWASIATASSYIRVEESRIQELARLVQS